MTNFKATNLTDAGVTAIKAFMKKKRVKDVDLEAVCAGLINQFNETGNRPILTVYKGGEPFASCELPIRFLNVPKGTH